MGIRLIKKYIELKTNDRIGEEFESKDACDVCDCVTTRYIVINGLACCKTCLIGFTKEIDRSILDPIKAQRQAVGFAGIGKALVSDIIEEY